MNGPLPFADATERNKAPILDVLLQELPRQGDVLEIGSATGQHVVWFAPRTPGLRWQPSDCRPYLEGLAARLLLEGSSNILPAIELDVLHDWPDGPFDAVFSANTAHIMAWDAVCAMFAGVGRTLRVGGVFCLYGPFNENGTFTSPSNEAFDRNLRRRSPEMGLRDIAALESLAAGHHMHLVGRHSMPANNQTLVFHKEMQSG